jgi:hypothetical protein
VSLLVPIEQVDSSKHTQMIGGKSHIWYHFVSSNSTKESKRKYHLMEIETYRVQAKISSFHRPTLRGVSGLNGTLKDWSFFTPPAGCK